MGNPYEEQQQTLAPVASALPEGFADPVPLGLLGYGMTTVLLSLANAAVYEAGSMVLAMAVFFGGIAQVIVAIMAYRNRNTFALTAFAGYGFLWITIAFLTIGGIHGWAGADSSTAMGFYLLMWAIFTFGLMIASSVAPRALTGVLVLTVILLSVLAIANWTESATIVKIGGWEGVLTGASAIYLAFAFLLNETFGRTVLPVGDPLAKTAG
ncbi:MAG: acetate uptake transporter [Actinobacteria bacterium]|nr:acetate uptake transporter [Actinomycetota bacterium]